MKTSILLSLIVLSSLLSQAQTFNECAVEFRTKWKEIELDSFTKKRDDKKMDSLRRTLQAAFDDCIIGNELPEFNLMSRNGKSFTNESLSGKVVYLNLWTIHCGACWAEIPALNKLDEVYNDNKDFVFISVLLDEEEDLVKFLQQHPKLRTIDFDLIANEAPFGNKDLKKTLSAPTHLFIDKYGKISKKLTGTFTDYQKQEAYLRKTIDELLAQ